MSIASLATTFSRTRLDIPVEVAIESCFERKTSAAFYFAVCNSYVSDRLEATLRPIFGAHQQ